MAATEKKNIWCISTPDGVAPEVVANQTMAASQGILMPNSPLYRSTSGTWKVTETTDTSLEPIQGLFAGLQDANSTWPLAAELDGSTEIRVALIDPADTYAVYVENDGTDAAMTQSYIGEQYGLKVSSTSGEVGYTTMNVNVTSGAVRVVQAAGNVSYKDDLTTAPGVAYVKFLAAVSTQAGERA